jgi:hypothetical protein
MGNRSSRDHSLSRRLVTFRDGQRLCEYAVTNYHMQNHNFDGNNVISFKFTKSDGIVYLDLYFSNHYYNINKQKTYKEGNIMYIELENYPYTTQDTEHLTRLHRIKWYDGLTKIHFNYDSTVN